MAAVITRAAVIDQIRHSGLDEFDVEDVEQLLDIMLEAFTALEVLSWLIFIDDELEGIPVLLVKAGRIREVKSRAQQMVTSAVTLGEAMES